MCVFLYLWGYFRSVWELSFSVFGVDAKEYLLNQWEFQIGFPRISINAVDASVTRIQGYQTMSQTQTGIAVLSTEAVAWYMM